MNRSPFHVRIWKGILLRPRLLFAVLVGVVVWLALPGRVPASTRALLGWNVGAGLHLLTSWSMMLRADVGSLRRRAAQQDEAEWLVLALAVLATIVSLAAIGVELQGGPGDAKPGAGHLALAGVTIVVSWLFMHTMITLHYARLYYGTGNTPLGGLEFPGTKEPDYGDFLYFSFTIGAAAQTSDVAISNRTLRRMVLAQTILSFLFNTTVLALAINIGASLL